MLRGDGNVTFQRIADAFYKETSRRVDPEIIERKITGVVQREEVEKAKEAARQAKKATERERIKELEAELKRMQEWDGKWEKERKKERARRAHFGI